MKTRAVYNWLLNIQSKRCMLCLASADTGRELCHACHLDLPWLGPHCRVCALPLPNEGQLCGQCQTSPPGFARVIAPFRYAFPLDSLIPAFKYHQQFAFGRLMAELLAEAIAAEYDDAGPVECLVPLPLHHRRQARRGFNQATELARPIAGALGLPLLPKALQRVKASESQLGLAAADRRRNLHDAFRCPAAPLIEGRHVALLDDVVTTGATVRAASRTLLEAGAREVSVWCVARTP
ncbi:comF family protein [Halopseudomonas xinjiangensis]|uniref:ComF family protein n=1 Tax=Halopseudomonas xinjiangensis TaxID=487184 RepID=A0A1H1VPP5_9GAMM|nr:ComF family protein [Halopseudomonas xinjiangensis]SDS86904.1 comF family protein [Halopseudomonas xinjiangensis]